MGSFLLRAIDKAILVLVGAIIIIAVAHVTADIIWRYAFDAPTAGTTVYVSNYYVIAIVFLPLASVESRGQHITVDLWPASAPVWLSALTTHIVSLLSAVVYGLLAYATAIDAYRKYQEKVFVLDQQIELMTWPSYWIVPVGFALVAILLLAKTVRPADYTIRPAEILDV